MNTNGYKLPGSRSEKVNVFRMVVFVEMKYKTKGEQVLRAENHPKPAIINILNPLKTNF